MSSGVSFARIAFAASLVTVLLIIRQWLCWNARWRTKWLTVLGSVVLFIGVASGALYFYISHRYRTAEVMEVPIVEYGNEDYPEDPAHWSIHYSNYNGRELTLKQKDATHFDFILEPLHPFIARIEIRDVDVSLMTPSLPEWAKENPGLRRIALTDRQWNRQQVSFPADSPHVHISGGDGFEKENVHNVELAKNCLNAGLWEVLLYEKDASGKALYYQDWFTFPLGFYKNIFELNTGFNYLDHWRYLEHWVDPAGTIVSIDKLREVTEEREVETTYNPDERVLVDGERMGKRRTTLTDDIRFWKDFYDGRHVQFASFVPPGRYSVHVPRHTQYDRMDRFEKVIHRRIQSPGSEALLDELELVFTSSKHPGTWRFFISGVDLDALPQLSINQYPKGFYMPMGIGTPPFHQSYAELQEYPPQQGPYVSVLLDENNGWIDHHAVGIDGPAMHRDEHDANLLHVYLLSYERHSLIGHFIVDLTGSSPGQETGSEHEPMKDTPQTSSP